jgi:hypothetical protein
MDNITHSLVYSSWFAALFPLWLLILASTHLFACLYYAAGLVEQHWDYPSWIDQMAAAGDGPRMYIYSVYFALVSMLTIGTGDVPAISTSERILVLVLSLVGACVNAYCVGAMVNFLIDPIGADFLQSFSGLWTYLKFKGIPEDLRTEVLNVFQEKWNSYEGAPDPRAVFKLIPETVRDRMKLDIVRTCVMRITFMYMSSEKLLVAFANVLKPFTACPDEVVIREGDVVPVLFLFRSGVIRLYRRGALFAENNCDVGVALGDYELLIDHPQTYTVRAVTYVEGWTLRREDLVLCMKHQIGLRDELIDICQYSFGDEQYREIRTFLESIGPYRSRRPRPSQEQGE